MRLYAPRSQNSESSQMLVRGCANHAVHCQICEALQEMQAPQLCQQSLCPITAVQLQLVQLREALADMALCGVPQAIQGSLVHSSILATATARAGQARCLSYCRPCSLQEISLGWRLS